jgi:hypothetical protein
VIIKQADSQDIAHINEMMLHSFSYWSYTQEELHKIMDLLHIDEEYLTKHGIYLAHYDKKDFFGFFSFIKNSDQENQLDYFLIRKDLIGFGYGQKMWEVCCDKAKSCRMKDFIIISNPYAEGFYQKMGAKKIGSRPSTIRLGASLPVLKFSL